MQEPSLRERKKERIWPLPRFFDRTFFLNRGVTSFPLYVRGPRKTRIIELDLAKCNFFDNVAN